MIVVADSGSTKTSWCFSFEDNNFRNVSTGGINPFFRTTDDIYSELKEKLAPETGSNVKQVYFYGAGIVNQEKGNVVKRALHLLFPDAAIEVQSDLMAAARATLQNESGIACILGTGSNSCLYNGKEIQEHIPPLGFILGDEGSGAVLGRKLVGDFLKKIMPAELANQFKQRFSFEYVEFLNGVYRKEKPNMFLAAFVPFLKENIMHAYCSNLVTTAFEEFISRNVAQYTGYNKQPVCFVGSVAFHFQEQLKEVLKNEQLNPGIILKAPLEKLVEYHLSKI